MVRVSHGTRLIVQVLILKGGGAGEPQLIMEDPELYDLNGIARAQSFLEF